MSGGRLPSTPTGNAARQASARLALEGEILPPRPEPTRRQEPPRGAPQPAPKVALRMSTALAGLAGIVALGAAAAGGAYATASQMMAHAGASDRATIALARVQNDMGRLTASIDTLRLNGERGRGDDDGVRGLKKSVDVLRTELDALKGANAAALSQLSAKIDRPDRDPSPRLADIAARIDKLDRDPGPKLTDIAARLDRIERQVSSPAVTGSIAPLAKVAQQSVVSQTVAPQPVATAADKPLPKPATLGNWVVRDVYQGVALVEGRSGAMREIVPGQFLPGAGEVRSIERRGRAWVVVTSRGIIDTSTW